MPKYKVKPGYVVPHLGVPYGAGSVFTASEAKDADSRVVRVNDDEKMIVNVGGAPSTSKISAERDEEVTSKATGALKTKRTKSKSKNGAEE